jgi:hypothetical protein
VIEGKVQKAQADADAEADPAAAANLDAAS